MRKQYEETLKSFFHESLFRRRNELGLTQEETAYRLAMNSRSYIELDHGKSSCSSLTLARFLIYLCDDPLLFLNKLRHAFENKESNAA